MKKNILLLPMIGCMLMACINTDQFDQSCEKSAYINDTISECSITQYNSSILTACNAYADYLENNKESIEEKLDLYSESIIFSLEYINEDCIPEMIIGSDGMNYRAISILCFSEGGVISNELPESTYIEIVSYKNMVTFCNEHMSENDLVGEWNYYTYEINNNGELNLLCYIDNMNSCYTYFIGSDEVKDEEYYGFLNDRKCGERVYKTIRWNKNEDNIDFYLCTDENLSSLRQGMDELIDDAYDAYMDFFNGTRGAYINDETMKWMGDYRWDAEDWNACKIGSLSDVDNDGVREQIIYGPMGGFYLDYDSKELYVLPTGEHIGEMSYHRRKDGCWIMFRDTTHVGRYFYKFVKMDGQLIEKEISLLASESGDGVWHYYLNEEEISEEEYNHVKSEYLED